MQSALALHRDRFNEQNIAAGRRPREARHHADLIVLEHFIRFDFRHAEKVVQVAGRDVNFLRFAFSHAPRHLATDRTDFAFKLTQAGFAGVFHNCGAQCGVRDGQIFFADAVLFHLLRQNMPPDDLQLFLFGVTRQANHFHAVAQRRLNGVKQVGRRHKHDVRQIEWHAQVIVAEGKVLFRVEDFK